MKRGLLLCASLAALWASACSGGGTTVTPPPPTGPFSNSSLQGQYAFSMTGSEIASSGLTSSNLFTRVGSFTADGKGSITGGVEDINLVTGANQFGFTSGSYTVNGDGRGTLSLVDSSGTLTFSITLTSSSNGYMIAMPTDGLSTANGSFVKQDSSAFLVSGISGNYAFDLTGLDASAVPQPESFVGQFFANSAGQFTTGLGDDNDGAVIVNGGNQPITGTYAMDGLHPSDLANFGRGVFSLGGIQGVFYIVGHNQVKFMETTSGGALSGDAFTQSNIPTTTAGISGGFAYVMGGSGGAGPLARGGRFTATGGALSNILVDNNNAGTLLSLSASTGTYTIDSAGSGRGTITYNISGQKNTFTYVFYMISPTQAVVQDQSIGIVADGSLLGQPSATISDSSLGGKYVVNWSGLSSTNLTSDEEDLVGETVLSSGSLTGTIDLNEFASGKQFTAVPMTGTLKLSSDPTGHNALTFNLATNPANNGITSFAYVANNNTVLFMGTQTVRIIAGVLTPQTQ
jgi:hypothetical protein